MLVVIDMLKTYLKSCSLVLLCFLNPLNGFAQDIGDDVARKHEQRLLQEQQRIKERKASDIPTSDTFLQPKGNPEELIASDTTCVQVKLISAQGVEVLEDAMIDEITRSYVNRCLGLSEMNQLIKEVSNLYLERGYITSRAFIQPQGLKQGILNILVVEGKVESISSPNKTLTDRQLRWAFPVQENEVLNLRDLEQGIEQLNRLQQNQAKLDIKPGSNTGDSLVEILNTASSPFHANASVDNSGSEATGEWIAGLSLSWDNPLNINDNLYLTFSNAFSGDEGGESKSAATAYSLGRGYATFSINANYFEYEQLVEGTSIDFQTSGTASNQTIGMAYMVYRGQRDKLSLDTDFTRKESKNYLEDVFLETSSRTLYIPSAGLSYTRQLERGMLRAGFNWAHSMDVFDATTKVAEAEKDYQFDSYSLDFAISHNFSVGEQLIRYLSNLHIFYSPDDLIASEGLSIGGRYTMRGMEEETISGTEGFYWRNDLAYPMDFQIGRIEPFIGVDYGMSNTPDFNEDTATATGVVAGLRYAASYASVDLTYAEAIDTPDFLQAETRGIYFSARFFY